MKQQTLTPPDIGLNNGLNSDPSNVADSMMAQTLNLRDIHLPEPVSWWPIAPGWWLLAVTVLLLLIVIFIGRKIYTSRQLKRDIAAELESIKQQFQKTQNKSELAKSLSVLLRRTSLTYYPEENIAGLTGEDWLAMLDNSWPDSRSSGSHRSDNKQKNNHQFQSDIGKLLITAPYQTEQALADFDANALIGLCEDWLHSSHNRQLNFKNGGTVS